MATVAGLRCFSCGTLVEEGLAALGSLECHDCRGQRRRFAELPTRPVVVRIRVSDATACQDLVAFFRARACVAEQVRRNVVEVQPHPTLREAHARAEVDLLLGVWREAFPRVRAFALA
jgi:hypothetical protein